MQTSTVRCNGVRDSTEQGTLDNWAAEYARRLVEKEEAERKAADEKLKESITAHAEETATDKKSSHVFLSDAVDSTLNAASGKTAATPYAVKKVNDGLIAERNERKSQFEDLDNRLEQEISNRVSGDAALGKRIDAEMTARQNADTALGKRIDEEITDRGAADDVLRSLIDSEANSRIEADTHLGKRIDDEAAERKAADDALDVHIKAVEAKAHTHENKDILDAITQDRVLAWDTIADGTVTYGEYLEHLAEAERQFGMLWGLLGMTVYDGGWFGMEQLDTPLDGGLFEDEEFTPLDCGDFSEYYIPIGEIGQVIDGGNY